MSAPRITVADVAAYILAKHGQMTAMKLQKLVYYSQAWSLVWDDRPLFHEQIEAWANGPVCPDLYAMHRGQYVVNQLPQGNASALDDTAKETIDAILRDMGDMTAHQLSTQTHAEAPWIDARHGMDHSERGNRLITHGSMADYYGNLG